MDNNSLSASVNNTNMFSSVLSNACFCASLLKELAFFNSSTNVWVVVLIHFIITSFSTQCKKLILRSSFVLLTICSILALNNLTVNVATPVASTVKNVNKNYLTAFKALEAPF